ncbi:MAG TPA: hypothetical protein VKK19_17025 [Candidatus Dormibacteraeota bacterium]|nr:hypothetical protein [Candidatus Dormibacteraeota bacterium]
MIGAEDARLAPRIRSQYPDPQVWPGFSQRSVCTVSADGDTMTFGAEFSRDGTTWEPDLHVRYRRVGRG